MDFENQLLIQAVTASSLFFVKLQNLNERPIF